MITGESKGRIDSLWDAFRSGGISHPLEVAEQITNLMFLRRLDELQAVAERKASRTGLPVEQPLYTDATRHLRWRELVDTEPQRLFGLMGDEVFPWLRRHGADGSTSARIMRDARFTIPTAGLLARAMEMIDGLPLGADAGRGGDDDAGALYEYMLGKIAISGQNGRFRTPRHLIELIVAMMDPQPDDEICDPACGTAGFLVESAKHVPARHENALGKDEQAHRHYRHSMFHGFDFDRTMLRIGSMNMLLHGVAEPDIRYQDSLSENARGDRDRYSLILANPPFAGSLDQEATATDLQQVVKTKKTELLFVSLFLTLLRNGGRAAVIVPDGVLFGSTKAHKALRQTLVDDHKLNAVVKLPGGVFKPYAGVSTAILFFTKTGGGGTDHVWFYDVAADGWSLDDKRQPLLEAGKLGAKPSGPAAFHAADHERNNLPDVLERWTERNGAERERPRTAQSFCVPVDDIRAQGYDLSLNRYKEIVPEEVEHRSPLEIIADLERLESEIEQGMSELKTALG